MSVAKCPTHVSHCLDEPSRTRVYGRCRHRTAVLPSITNGAYELHHSDP